MTILEQLELEFVVRFELNDSMNLLTVTELCDENYQIELTKDKLAEFINELSEIHDKMNP